MNLPFHKALRLPERAGLYAVSVIAWLFCFGFLRWSDTWTPFAVAGPVLAVAVVVSQPSLRQRPLWQGEAVVMGFLSGIITAIITHLGFVVLGDMSPEIRASSLEMFRLLEVRDFSPVTRGALIVVIASSEEFVFRGGWPLSELKEPSPWRATKMVLLSAALYAFGTLPLGSWLLVAVAFTCGVFWGWLRLVTKSVAAPLIAHVVWDLGILVVWPLLDSSSPL